jgi:small subunit ribosomal protein S2
MGDKTFASAEAAGVTSDLQAVAEGEPEAEAAPAAAPEAESTEAIDLEAALGGGIRKAPAIVAALDEAEAAESGY